MIKCSPALVFVNLFQCVRSFISEYFIERFIRIKNCFILSVIGEEIGFLGLLILFAVTFFIIARGIKIAARCGDYYGFLIAFGITAVYAVQVAVNALVVTGSIPPTGLPLPLISAGNTSLVIFMTFFGVLYNVSKSNAKIPELPRAKTLKAISP